MEVVINKCFGGFGVSPEAMVKLIEGKSAVVEVHTPVEYYGEQRLDDYAKDLASSAGFGSGYRISQFGTVYKDGLIYGYKRGSETRSDPILIQVVKEMGKKASGRYAELKIVEVPDGVDFEIEEYDGVESIHERHRTWG